ncbi:Eco57I restriction-modification methylase domain-containing protein [Paenibacillus marchantiae]|uniref:Eco57I restriction-modification methylase domain-containing protein n=1 Tax=Paenibacillus TaxID=44249 RepID=UPI00237A0FDC|nr:Eco57I restriction-modification methylase domain-containing protein [Paenibacillus marchantiae]WDQ33867.1 Eco57I restriction-modification methylase domain-containing protein [Paenibacillus marchantiae]
MLELIDKKRSGSYYTKPGIVSLILDLVGYTIDKPLFDQSLLEPSTGAGAFLVEAVDRLLDSTEHHHGKEVFSNDKKIFSILSKAITSIEIDSNKYSTLCDNFKKLLCNRGLSDNVSEKLVKEWVINENFLLWNKPVVQRYNYIVGNPPYIRIENVEDGLEKKYRNLYKTLFDRADIYVAFIEHSLEMLDSGGKLNFICTDRFTKNQYGKKIRNFINDNFRVLHFMDIHNSQPFVEEVSAYPCIFTIENAQRGAGRTLRMDCVTNSYLDTAKNYLLYGKQPTTGDVETHKIDEWFKGTDPWILNGKNAQLILNKLEKEHPVITDAPHFIHVGIGVATGAKDVYVINPNKIDIEPDILLPVVTKDDIAKGIIEWRGYYVINPYLEDGSLVSLDDYPKLKKHLIKHEELLKSRSTAKSNPTKWYKTIDRIFPERLEQQKLLIPDIKSKNLIVKDKGEYYPEHSLYYVTAGSWDIDALQAILVSSVVKFFVWSYATKMRGDYLRYQAQYLKKIRLPSDVSENDVYNLKRLHQEKDFVGIDHIAQRLFNLSDEELLIIQDLVQ